MSPTRAQELEDALARRILIMDGAMGTMLQEYHPAAGDFGGEAFENCNENLCRTRPSWIRDIHQAYLDAGADVIATNSFQGSPVVLAEFGLENDAYEINLAAARLARQAADRFATGARPRFVAGALGPTTKSLTLRGDITFQQLGNGYHTQARALVEGGADILLLETGFDTRNIKAGLAAIARLERELGIEIPKMVSATIERRGAMLAGQRADALYASLARANLLSIGLNCATGPDMMTDHIRTLASMASTRISCYPNAGLPDERDYYPETPDSLAAQLEKFVAQGWVNILGGCCGTTAAHIRAIAEMAEGRAPHAVNSPSHRAWFTGVDLVEADESTRPLIVGERTNVIGSRLFKDLIAAEKWDEASEIARRQVRNGAHIIDVCLQSPDRDEIKDVDAFYAALLPKVRVPLMVDSTDPRAIERALAWCQGRSIVNSVNLEDGGERFARVCPVARTYGAALVVGTIDEDKERAQAFTRERKLAVAVRSVDILTREHGMAPEDILIDPLVFPCATGDENYIGAAVETIAAIPLVKQQLPHVRTILGISNVSFGLPAAAREVVNSVFLYHATRAGLDLAIVNSEKLERFASIPGGERQLAENLLFNRPPEGMDAPEDWRLQSREQRLAINQQQIAAITEYFRKAGRRDSKQLAALTPDERLARYIIEGSKDGLAADLDRKLAEGTEPVAIINGPLMAGMNEVGRMFNNSELIVAEVLQSAEVMKAAVTHLEPHMHRTDAAKRGRILVATVKGDVHDIGKNLVEIILANNGFEVINLGIKVSAEDLIQAWQEHQPDAIGLSGLLVKSAHQMIATVQDFRDKGVSVPLLVGGAALSAKFAATRIGPVYGGPTFYAKDAMSGLRIMNELADPAKRAAAVRDHIFSGEREDERNVPAAPMPAARSSKVRTGLPIPAAPHLERRVAEVTDLREIWTYLNSFMLYGKHLGFKGKFADLLREHDPKAIEMHGLMEAAKEYASAFMRVRALWQFFEAEGDGNSIHLFAPGGASPLHSFAFPRQPKPDGLCLSDYVLDPRPGERDHVALFVVSAGEGVRGHSEQARKSGEFFLAHAQQAIAIETAEAAAEWLHRTLREDWGFPDPPHLTMQQRFTAHYRGKRYSPGFPACPGLDDQQGIWKLLRPEEIGISLTENMMMDPEASVSALVFHHPDCTYFSAADDRSGPGDRPEGPDQPARFDGGTISPDGGALLLRQTDRL